jgi:hypothetical protein
MATNIYEKKYATGLTGFEPAIFRVTGGCVGRYTTTPCKYA